MSSHREGPFPNLDAYRGIGMLLVMTNHVTFATNMRGRHPELNQFLARTDVGVPMFFLVSGFLIFRPFATSLLTDRSWPSIRNYARNRAVRIMPAYWVALAGVMIWFGIPIVTGAGIFDHRPLGPMTFYALLLQTFSAQSVFKGFGEFDQSWSIGAEVTFYVAVPFLAMAARRFIGGLPAPKRLTPLLWCCAGLWLIGHLWRIGLVQFAPSWGPSGAFWLPAHIDFFAIGMAMALWSVAAKNGGALPRFVEVLGRRPWLSWLCGFVAWLVVVNPGGYLPLLTIRPSPLIFTYEYVVKLFFYGIFGFFFVLPAIFGPQRDGLIRAVLGSRVMVALGAVSLGFYLWHKAWLTQAERWTDAQPFQGSFVQIWLITLAGGLACGIACHFLIERPLMQRKRSQVMGAAVSVAVAPAAAAGSSDEEHVVA